MKIVDVTIKDVGTISFELWIHNAPQAISNLLEVINLRKYDNKPIERYEPNFVLQPLFFDGLDPIIDTMVDLELNKDIPFDRGIVAMAGTNTQASGSQFFITLQRTPRLDNHFTIIGKVIKGDDILQSLEQRDVIECIEPFTQFTYHTFKEDVIVESVRVDDI